MLGSLKTLAEIQEQDRDERNPGEGKHEVHYTSPFPARSWQPLGRAGLLY